MDSYPYQRNQMMYVLYYYPSGQTARPHLNVDPARSMVPCEPWPFGGNQGYTYPEFHGCCYHNFQPSCYAFRPPYPYVAPHHCLATYSAYPVHYVPPPYFSTDQPRYEFEKNLPTQHHYCGCSNHPCKQNVKIVEHDVDSDRKNAQAMVPINAQGHPYPVVWLPYGDARREHAKPYKSEHEDREEAYNEAKPSRDLESSEQPIVWNGWSPLNMKSYEGMKKGEDSQTNRKKQDDNSMSFPFPIFWMPYQPDNTRKMERQGSDIGQNSEQQLASNIESMHKDKDENKTFKSMKNEVSTGNNENMVNKESFRKIIPVKQLEKNDMKWTSDKNEEKSINASTNHTNDFGDKKLDENGAKKVSSPKKPSKLAPVCLRVDPLPRKKGNNGGSRSPSPPGGKGKSQDVTKDKPVNGEISERKCPVTCGLPDGASEVEESKCKTKGTEGTTQGDEQKDLKVGCTDSTSRSDNQIGNGGVEAPFEPEKKCPGESTQCDNTEGQMKKQLSEDEAATVIQSAYRAYEVRKWEPLKKLKQIANVGEQVAEIRGHIQALEHSPNKMVDTKQKIVIAETIMSLLLKLDTIQGLHPTVRDIRKSVARELVSLQEKLDSIPDSSSQVVTELSIKAEDTTRVHENVAVMQGHRGTNTMEQCEDESLALESSETMVNGQGNNEESQPISKKLEVKDILEHEECVSSPHRPTEELSNCDGGEKIETTSKEMDEHVKNLVDLSQEDNAQHIKDLAEIDTEFSQENITGCVEPACVLDEESTTGNNTGMPQDEASRGLEAEPPSGKEIIEQLLPVNSNPDNNMECEEKEVKDVNTCQIALEEQVKNEVAELPELNDKSGTESILQQEAIDENTKLNKAEELVEVAMEKTQGAVDKDPESIDLKPIDIQVDDQKLQEENNNVAAESDAKDVENFDWPQANEQSVDSSKKLIEDIQSEDSSKKLIEENEKLRKLMEEMIESGKEQLTTISALSSRLNQLEKKLSRKKKLKMRQRRAPHIKSDASSQVM